MPSHLFSSFLFLSFLFFPFPSILLSSFPSLSFLLFCSICFVSPFYPSPSIFSKFHSLHISFLLCYFCSSLLSLISLLFPSSLFYSSFPVPYFLSSCFRFSLLLSVSRFLFFFCLFFFRPLSLCFSLLQ